MVGHRKRAPDSLTCVKGRARSGGYRRAHERGCRQRREAAATSAPIHCHSGKDKESLPMSTQLRGCKIAILATNGESVAASGEGDNAKAMALPA